MRKSLKVLAVSALAAVSAAVMLPVIGHAEETARINMVSSGLVEDGRAGGGPDYADGYTPLNIQGGCFEVVTSPAAVYYQVGKKKVQTDVDYTIDGGESDVYLFDIPTKTLKKGGTETITIVTGPEDHEVTKELKLTFEKPEVKEYKITASYDATEKTCTYGKIKAEGSENKKYSIYTKNEMVSYSNENRDEYGNRIKTAIMGEDTPASQWNRWIKPLIRKGSTVYVAPTYKNAPNMEVRSGYYASVASITADEVKIKTIQNVVKEAKVKIAKQKAAPKVKVDVLKGIITTNAKQEYAYNCNGRYSEWTKAAAKMQISSITNSAVIASGMAIKVRIAGTEKAVPSAYTFVTIPERTNIDLTKLKMSGPATKAALEISDFEKTKKPYEYTTEKPSSSTKWKAFKSGSITFTGKTAFSEGDGVKIYIREKGYNENIKNKIATKVPSTIMSFTYAKEGNVWSGAAIDMSEFK